MHTIIADNIATAHEAVVKLIMTSDCNDIVTEDEELIFEYPGINIHIIIRMSHRFHLRRLNLEQKR